MSEKLKNTSVAIGMAICLTWATLYATDILNLRFDPEDYSTHTRILQMEPKIKLTTYGKRMIVIDDQELLYIPTQTYFFQNNGFSSNEFLQEVHAGDMIEYIIEKETVIFNNSNEVQSIRKGTKTYLTLEHLAYKNSSGYRFVISTLFLLLMCGILYNAVLMVRR